MAKNDFYGKPLVRRRSESTQDKSGLWEGVIVWSCPKGQGYRFTPKLGSRHPDFPIMEAEKIRVSEAEGFDLIEVSYAGGDPEEIDGGGAGQQTVYELIVSTGEEPITTHPNFSGVKIAGTPESPKNGAYFDPVTKKFLGFTTDPASRKYGVESYLDASQITWRVTSLARASVSTLNAVGSISNPAGPAPSLGAGRNWLFMGVTSEKRGAVYVVSREWRASGRRGWDTDIYS